MSTNPNVEERTPDAPVDTRRVGERLLSEADQNGNGRAAVTLTPTSGGPLKQTLLALQADHELSEHTAPGPATVLVLRGSVVLRVGEDGTTLDEGQWSAIPREKHTLRAVDDTVCLLTVAPEA
ncbi:MAG: cupin domain-containing protein [Nitriliruptorales bacterium]|nr:cupin domain-containing protein [Nitriliruptorales bacterium]